MSDLDLPIPATEDREEEQIKVFIKDIQETTNNVSTLHSGHPLPTHSTHPLPTHGVHPLPSHLGSNSPTQRNTRPLVPLLPPKDKTSILTNIILLMLSLCNYYI